MKKYTVSEAAKKTGVAPTTIYGMIEHGELPASDSGGVLQLDEQVVRAMPRRPVGHPKSPPRQLKGAGYAAALRMLPESDQSVNVVAAAYGVTPSAVRDAVARYEKAVARALHKVNP